MKWIVLILFLTFAMAKETILVSILPQAYIVKEIVKEKFNVKPLIPKGANPASYALKPKDLETIQQAKLYLSIKVPFERAWMERIKSANPNLKVVDMGRYTKRYPMEAHHHKKEHAHDEGLDPHIWLAPTYIILMARATLDEVIKLDPNNANFYLQNFKAFAKRMIELDQKVYKRLLLLKNRSFLVYHPSFGYFARVYQLKQIPIEIEGKEPKPKELLKLIKLAHQEGIKQIIIEPQFPKRSAILLARKIKAKVITLDPLAYDLKKSIEKIVKEISNP